MEQLIYSSILFIFIVIWMIINKKNINKHILEKLENVSPSKVESNVSLRSFYYYCEKHKIDCDLKGEEMLVKYNSKIITCKQKGDFRMGKTLISLKKDSKKSK